MFLDSLRGGFGRSRPLGEIDTRLMARAGSYLYGSGATLVLVTLLLPHTGDVQPVGVAGVAMLALALAAALHLVGHRFPVWLLALVSPMGSVMIGGVMYFGGGYAIAFAMLYVWAALYSFSFFQPRSALLQGGAIAATAAINLLLFRPLANSPAFLLMVMGTGAVAGVFVDRLLRQVRALGRLDAVTGAPNRAAWDDEIPRAMGRAARSGKLLSVLIADLDHFKVFNDEYGHQAGDRLLAELVKTWSGVLRTTDLLSRYGGEEFAILVEGCSAEEAYSLAEKLRALVPGGQTASFGVAEWDQREAAEAVVARADSALYEAKRNGRNQTVTAPNRLTVEVGQAGDTARWASTVREILDSGRDGTYDGITSVYQPVVRLDSGIVVGAEALARPTTEAQWLSVEGLFYTAQRIGLARELDWLCRRAAVDGAEVFRHDFPLFINVSTVALLDPMQAVDQLNLVLLRGGRTPSSVVLELSEREIVVDHGRLADVLAQYREAGFRFAIDDLGEGHSGFALLEATAPDYVKLARKLTIGMDSPATRPLLAAALAFAESSGCEVVAEGIETQAQVERLLALGVRLGQGYPRGRPARPAALLERLEAEAGRAHGEASG
ncbi:MAG: EAL domain-containing protein [Candidatus Dormibacteria bacterium]